MLRIDIINRALVSIGARALQNEQASGGASRVLEYDTLIPSLLACYPWSFASSVRQLARLTEPPAQHWRYQFQLPADRIGPPRAIFESKDQARAVQAFELTADRVLTDASELWARYLANVQPGLWSPMFLELAVKALQAEYAFSVREDTALRSRLREEVYGPPSQPGIGGLLGRVRQMDAQSKPSQPVAGGRHPLIDVRRS